jgi:PPP family 3-phenylpropionic acid transporter
MLLQNLQGALWVFGIYAATRALSTSLIPLSESIALTAVSRFRLDFGRLRGVGSMAVVVTTVALGAVVDRYGLDFVAWALAFLYLIQTAAAGLLPSLRATSSQVRKVPLVQVMRLPGFALFLCCAASSQACHGLFYTYSVIYWKSLGLSSSVIGVLWSLGVLAEIVVFMLGDRIMARLSAATLILAGCVGGVVRWTLLAEGEHLGVMLVVQLLQATTLGFTQLGAAQFIKTAVPEQAISSGSGIYAAAVGGLTAAAVYGGSRLYAAFGGQAFALSTVMCLGGAVAATLLRRHLRDIPLAKSLAK